MRAPATKLAPHFVVRHSLATRLTHWINAACVFLLLMSGAQIFMAHPELYWGQYGADGDPSVVEIGAGRSPDHQLTGFARLGATSFATTGFLGALRDPDGDWRARAFPYWATLPGPRSLALGRRWHFFAAWIFALNLAVYFGFGLASDHLRRDLLPSWDQLKPRSLLVDLLHHLKLQFPRGEAARRYNPLQKIAYLGIVALILPTAILTGLTMSPGMDAIAPWLVDLFGGRQSARTIHFICANLILLFILVHLAMVILAGPINEIRSMLTGKLKIFLEEGHEPRPDLAP